MMTPVAAPSRLLPLVGAYNFRDLGGYVTVDGRTTRWGRLFRSDTLHELTADDLAVLRSVGLASVIDLRTGHEVAETGRGLLESETVGYVHLSVMPEAKRDPDTARPSLADLDLASVYLGWLESGRASLVAALTLVGDGANYPLVFHCAAGKDRTGVLAALVLDIIGVETETIVADYALTATRLDLIRSRQITDTETADRMIEAPHLFGAEAQTMENFLDALNRQHGGGRQWALAAGVAPATLASMTSTLLG
jgi:protein tyrosine/serine phosphatase